MHKAAVLFDWAIRLTPAAALFSLFFVMEGNMRWLGLLGLLPLVLATQPGCPTCGPRADACDPARRPWKTWPGH
jgi:hypothetical protein